MRLKKENFMEVCGFMESLLKFTSEEQEWNSYMATKNLFELINKIENAKN